MDDEPAWYETCGNAELREAIQKGYDELAELEQAMTLEQDIDCLRDIEQEANILTDELEIWEEEWAVRRQTQALTNSESEEI